MKKIIFSLIAMLFVTTLVACSDSEEIPEPKQNTHLQEDAVDETPTESSTNHQEIESSNEVEDENNDEDESNLEDSANEEPERGPSATVSLIDPNTNDIVLEFSDPMMIYLFRNIQVPVGGSVNCTIRVNYDGGILFPWE